MLHTGIQRLQDSRAEAELKSPSRENPNRLPVLRISRSAASISGRCGKSLHNSNDRVLS